ncbi:hypothetical protein [Paenibacillus sp. SAF-054]|uniref:hypothetical protein n=1 Tax=Paenibacillus sp. SAF-054 TaxID=3436863 RepID=UPI003F7D7CA8
MEAFGLKNFEILGFWDFGILGFWDFGILGFWDFGILGCCVCYYASTEEAELFWRSVAFAYKLSAGKLLRKHML